MNPVVAVLEKFDIVSANNADERIFRSPLSKIQQLSDELKAALYQLRHVQSHELTDDSLDAFNFLASSSMRGDSTCQAWECRSKKLDLLGRFAALYADCVIVPFPVPSPDSLEDSPWGRMRLADRIKLIVVLRPLIEAGLVRLVEPQFHYCAEHAIQAKRQTRKISRATTKFCERELVHFTATYQPPQSNRPAMVSLDGPDEYLEHGHTVVVFPRPPDWAPTKIRAREFKVSRKLLKSSGLVHDLYSRIADDLVMQQLYGIRYNARYLTDLPGEADVAATFNEKDDLSQRTAALVAALAHSVPLFSDVPLAKVVRIRKEVQESLTLYRAALSEIVKSHVNSGEDISPKKAGQIYREELEPQITRLKIEANNYTCTSRRRAITRLGLPFIAIGLSFYSGLLPEGLSELFKAIGGITLLREVADTLTSMERYPAQIRNHNLYFLLRLSE